MCPFIKCEYARELRIYIVHAQEHTIMHSNEKTAVSHSVIYYSIKYLFNFETKTGGSIFLVGKSPLKPKKPQPPFLPSSKTVCDAIVHIWH